LATSRLTKILEGTLVQCNSSNVEKGNVKNADQFTHAYATHKC